MGFSSAAAMKGLRSPYRKKTSLTPTLQRVINAPSIPTHTYTYQHRPLDNPDLQPTPFLPHNLSILSDGSYVLPPSSEVALDASTAAPAATAAPTISDSPSETQGERRQRLKQMQDTVQQLQRNLSVSNSDSPATSTAVESESEVVAMRRQMDMLLGEVERLRATLAADHALPAYEE